ncbi:hypothetical protein [Marilutibacter chinensis]|uniref:Uncharacterized protein n=1 Tax=Marilutibacter chinensis TaxID=2912247 RepID=A0ABS9HST0_9GAMM|nr:hypothetical protein [Lysobacter chinensis]MCF7221137.1 hypothetical protein [Lysobacter chinensis]
MDLPPVADSFEALVHRCDLIEVKLPQLRVEFAETSAFNAAFAAIASALLSNAEKIEDSPVDAAAYVRKRLDAMLETPDTDGGSGGEPSRR